MSPKFTSNDQSSAYLYLPDAGDNTTASKEFHLDFGNGNDGFPKTSVIQCIISNGDDTQEIPTHVTVH